jgi:hypothetical protein
MGNEILVSGGYLMIVLPPSITSEDKHVTATLALRHLEHNIELLQGMYGKLTEWLETGVIKVWPTLNYWMLWSAHNNCQPNKVDLLPNGLGGIVEGLKKMEQDQVSGVKLVVRPEETPA